MMAPKSSIVENKEGQVSESDQKNQMAGKPLSPENQKPSEKAMDDKEASTEQTDGKSSKKTEGRFTSEGYFIRDKGISWPMCALFVLGDMAGGGIVALPSAIKNTFFWPGIVSCLIICAVSTYTSVLIGKCWSILQQRYPEYRKHCRQVYAEIGNKAIGRWMKHVVLRTLDINQFGVTVIYLLLSAKSLSEAILTLADYSFDKCYIILILAALLLPVTWLKSPADFWWSIFGAMACSILSVILIIVGSGLDFGSCHNPKMAQSFPPLVNILAAFGNMVFSFGGHSSFPTIQHDMREPFNFHKSTYMAYVMALLVYLPMAVFANVTYGSYISDSIINSVQNVPIQQSINLMIMLHCICAFCLVLNPLNQQVEELFKAPQTFGWKRVGIRSVVMLIIVFTALSLPSFGPLLDLVGASTTLATVLIFPPLFHFYLVAAGRIHDEKMASQKKDDKISESEANVESYSVPTVKQVLQYNDTLVLVIGVAIMAFGVLICITSTFSAGVRITYTDFEPPCYVQWIKGNHSITHTATNCCNGQSTIQGTNKTCDNSNYKFYSEFTVFGK